MFDILTFLEKYTTIVSGPNEKGEVFLRECPKCGVPSTHQSSISVNIIKRVFHCFRCGSSGPLTTLVAHYMKIPYQQAEDMFEQDLGLKREVKKKEVLYLEECELPPQAYWSKRAEKYLEERGLSRSTIAEFGLYYCSQGKYQGRIIIPVIFEGKVVTFQARTVMPKEEVRYLSPFNAPKSRVWFNLDNYDGQDVNIVEGPFDVMKLHQQGVYAICALGKNISNEQAKILVDKRIKVCHIVYDNDALVDIPKIWESLCRHLEVRIRPIIFEGKDPADMIEIELAHVMHESYESAYDVRQMIFNKWKEGKNEMQ